VQNFEPPNFLFFELATWTWQTNLRTGRNYA